MAFFLLTSIASILCHYASKQVNANATNEFIAQINGKLASNGTFVLDEHIALRTIAIVCKNVESLQTRAKFDGIAGDLLNVCGAMDRGTKVAKSMEEMHQKMAAWIQTNGGKHKLVREMGERIAHQNSEKGEPEQEQQALLALRMLHVLERQMPQLREIVERTRNTIGSTGAVGATQFVQLMALNLWASLVDENGQLGEQTGECKLPSAASSTVGRHRRVRREGEFLIGIAILCLMLVAGFNVFILLTTVPLVVWVLIAAIVMLCLNGGQIGYN